MLDGPIDKVKFAANVIDMAGMRFTRLTVLERRPTMRAERGDGKGSAMARWLCRCDCGKEVVVARYNLLNELTKSCGCFNRDALIARNQTRRNVVFSDAGKEKIREARRRRTT